MKHTSTRYAHSAPYGPHNLPHQPCSQRQGTLAAAIPPLLARLGAPPTQDEGAVCRAAQEKQKKNVSHPAQEEGKSDVSTPHRQACMCACVRVKKHMCTYIAVHLNKHMNTHIAVSVSASVGV